MASTPPTGNTDPSNDGGELAAQFREFGQRRRRIEELQLEGKRQQASSLLDGEYVDSLHQEVMSDLAGQDPLYNPGATVAMTAQTRAMRQERLIGERMAALDLAITENKDDIDYLNGVWKTSVAQFQDINKATLAELHSLTPEQAAERLKPLKLFESEAGNIQGRIGKLNARFKQIDPTFSVFSHPATSAAAHGLGVMTNGDIRSMFKQQHDPLKGFLGETLTNVSAVAYGAAEGAVEGTANLARGAYEIAKGTAQTVIGGMGGSAAPESPREDPLALGPLERPIAAAHALTGDWIVRGALGEQGYQEAQQHLLGTTGFPPELTQTPHVELNDEHGNSTMVRQRFGLPELVAPLGALLYGQSAAEFARDAREAKEVWRAYSDEGGWGWGLAADVSNFVGGLYGLGVATKPFMAATMAGKTQIAKGMAQVAARTSPTAKKIADVLGSGAAQAAAFGTYETISHGFTEGYTDSFVRGAETGLVFMALGAMGHQVESLALRKEMPLFLSNALGAIAEGVGMTGYGIAEDVLFRDTPAGKALWDFIGTPNHETKHNYSEALGVNVLGMLAFKAAFGRHATRANLLEQRLTKARRAEEGRQVTLQEAGKREVGEKTAQMLMDLQEGRPDAPFEAFRLARYHRDIAPIAKEIGRQGREEAAIGQARTEPEQRLPGSLSGRSGTYTVEATENLAERLIRMNRRQDARAARGEGSSLGTGELGVTGTFIGGRMVFTARKGSRERQEMGSSVNMGDELDAMKGKLERQGHTPAEIENAMMFMTFTIHNHPDSNSLSGADIKFMSHQGNHIDFVMTDRGMFAVHPREGAPKAVGDLQHEIGLRMGQLKTEKAAELGLPPGLLSQMWVQSWSNLKKTGSRGRLLGELGAELYARAAKEVGATHGLDIEYFPAQEGIERWKEFQKSGDPEVFTRDYKPGVNVLREKLGQSGDVLLSSPSAEKREALASAYEWYQKTKDPEVFFDIAGEQLGAEGLAKTPENVERVMQAAGIDVGKPMVAGEPDKEGPGRTSVSDRDLLSITRSQAQLEVAAREMEKEGRFSRRIGLGQQAEFYDDVARRVREMGQTGRLASPTGEPGEAPKALPVPKREGPLVTEEELLALGMGEGGEPPGGTPPAEPFGLPEPGGRKRPSDEDAAKFFANMFARRSKLVGAGPSIYQKLKSLGDRFVKAFKNPSTYELIAERVQKAGYRAPFRKLGQDEEFVLAETDRLQGDLGNVKRNAMGDLGDVFKPITDKIASKKATADGGVIELMDTLEYASLKDLFDNRVRIERELIRDEAGQPLLDQQGRKQYREKEVEVDLPGGTTPEQLQKAMLEAEGRLSPEGRQAYENMRRLLDSYWQSMVDRGVARPESKQQSYFPRKIVDYDDLIAGIGPMRDATPPREPFRGFLKARKGSERLVDATPETLANYFAKVRITNAIHDYNTRVARGIENRLLHELGTTRAQIKDMTPEQWNTFRTRAEKEHHAIVVDLNYGRLGARTLERDPVTLDTIASIHELTDTRVVPEAVIGRNMRPDDTIGQHLVTKEMVEMWRSQRRSSSWMSHPLLRGIRAMIGKWKMAALRGAGGARVFGRNARNLISDETAIAFKDSLKALMETNKLLPKASPISAALAHRDTEKAILGLSPSAQSIARELQRYHTTKTGPWNSDVEAIRGQLQGEWLKHYVPETGDFLKWIGKLALGDFRWAQAVDDYSENLVRIAYFWRERMSALRDIKEGKLEPRPGETGEEAATRRAHLQVSDVLINYNWLTPLEKTAFNGLLFPFYTWSRYNLTKQLSEVIRHPVNSMAKYATYAGAIGLFNWLISPEDEDRLTMLRPDLAGKGHLWVPGVKDEFGNPLLVTWEDTFTAATDFLGLSGAGNKVGAYVLGHGNEELLLAALFPQGIEQAQRTFANATAPWVRHALDVGYRTSYQTVGERAENVERTVQRSFLPLTDAMRYLGRSDKDFSAGQRVLTQIPMLRYIDLSTAVPTSLAGQQFTAGRIQREAAQTSLGVERHMQRFVAGLKNGNSEMMQDAVDQVWADYGDEMTRSGQSVAHLWARMLRVGTQQMMMQEMATSGMPPKFWQLTRTQQVDFLMRQEGK